jgi:hypothetical protein
MFYILRNIILPVFPFHTHFKNVYNIHFLKQSGFFTDASINAKDFVIVNV